MFTKKLRYSKTIYLHDDSAVLIDYYITMKTDRLYDDDTIYGIEIEKFQENDVSEIYSALHCMRTYEEADTLLNELSSNTVTPVSAPEVIDVILNRT